MMKTDRADKTGKKADKSVALRARTYGVPANPKLLILHGLFGSSVNWRTVAGQLSASREVFCLDLRNHGQSPWHDDMGYRAMAGDVARFIVDHHLQCSALMGHSMGGKTAMMLAQEQRIELAKLIVVDIAPVTYRHAHHLELAEAMRSIDLETTASREQIDALLATRIPDSGTRQFLAQNLIKDGKRYSWRLNLDAILMNMDALAGYENDQVSTVDTLFVAGADSDYIAPASHSEICRRFPNARIETIEKAGHWLHAEQPARLVALCNSFLAG